MQIDPREIFFARPRVPVSAAAAAKLSGRGHGHTPAAWATATAKLLPKTFTTFYQPIRPFNELLKRYRTAMILCRVTFPSTHHLPSKWTTIDPPGEYNEDENASDENTDEETV